jgi:REP element-mobilizing transposase RayT
MAHTYSSSLFHCVFSTKQRGRLIGRDLKPRLWSYLGGIAREHKMKALAVGGTEDHVHLLLSLPANMAPAKAMQLIKGGSSKWVGDEFGAQRDFGWQEGYGAFSIGVSGVVDTVAYIAGQEEHHRRATFEEEYVRFLTRHGIAYDERYVFD